MSAREWKPGDVAMVTAMNRDRFRATFDGEVWREHGDLTDWKGAFLIEPVDIRPLVVIDPESDDVERLAEIFCSAYPNPGWVSFMRDALRELADPKPPRPEEPTGAGALVVDTNGTHWSRIRLTAANKWVSEFHDCATWPQIDVVRVLHEGVQP